MVFEDDCYCLFAFIVICERIICCPCYICCKREDKFDVFPA